MLLAGSEEKRNLKNIEINSTSLLVGLLFKVVTPAMFDFKFSRTVETIVGVGLPVLLLALFELYYRSGHKYGPDFMVAKTEIKENSERADIASQKQNVFGIKVIAISMAVVGIGITVLGIMASEFSDIVICVGVLIFLLAVVIYWRIRKQEMIPSSIP